jgi:Hemerythrin HHE cation binding domain
VTKVAGELRKDRLIDYRRGYITVLEQECCECYGVVSKGLRRLAGLSRQIGLLVMNMLQGGNNFPAETETVADVFVWDSQFETGIAEIDRQHLKLVQLINRLGRILVVETEADSLTRALFSIFDELANYVEYHFKFEEELMGHP